MFIINLIIIAVFVFCFSIFLVVLAGETHFLLSVGLAIVVFGAIIKWLQHTLTRY